MTHDATLLAAYRKAVCKQLKEDFQRIQHCVDQLDHEQLWWRPSKDMNSIANLLLHLAGNLRQWLVVGLQELTDERKRQEEFDDRSNRTASELMGLLSQAVEAAVTSIESMEADSAVQVRHIQQFEVDGFQAIAGSTTHFAGHVQEIVHMTRCIKGDDYQLLFVPTDPN